jgi:hypothetical protein
MATAVANRIISGSIPNFINGVSQQPFALRLASQAEEQINAYSSIVEGLTKRPPTRFVAKLLDSAPDDAFIHIINRDLAEKYVVLAYNNDLKVYDFDGVEKTVNFPNGKGYLYSPKANFGAVTVADYTFFLNKDGKTAMTAETIPARSPEAIVYVRQGNYATTYRLVVGGVVVEHTTSTTDPNGIQTTAIAMTLGVALNGSAAPATCQVVGSTIYIVPKAPATDFTIRVEDTMGNTAMLGIKDKTQSFANLPAKAYSGFQVEVTGSAGNDYDNYYLRYDATGTDGWDGVWREIAQPGRKIAIDPATMPYTLIREADGTFTFKQATWDKCEAGDSKTNPQPSFIGKPLSDMFFFRNRLGFVADENVIMSKNGYFFDFFRDTATALLDTDPIDVAVSHVKVSILRHAVPFNESLLLFSDQTQFLLSGEGILSPATVSINATTEFETSNIAKPVGAASFIYFTTRKGGFSGIREFYVDGQTRTNSANDITAHVPKYIPGNITKLTASTNEDVLLALADGEKNSIFVYKYYYAGQEKVQSSMSRWSFPATTEVLDAQFIESTCWVVVRDRGVTQLLRMDIAPGITEVDMEYTIHLDSRVTSDMITRVVETPLTGTTTTFTMPYPVADLPDLQVVALADDNTYKPGAVVPILSKDGSTVTVRGDVDKAVIGRSYCMSFLFSPLILRQEAPGGGQMANTQGRLQLRRMIMNYADTGYFRVEVTPLGRQAFINEFTGRVIGSNTNRLGLPSIATGSFRFPILGQNMNVSIILKNDSPFPSRILNADWEAMYTVRTSPM